MSQVCNSELKNRELALLHADTQYIAITIKIVHEESRTDEQTGPGDTYNPTFLGG